MCKMLIVYKDIQQDSIQVSYRTVLYWTMIPQHNHLMEMCKTLIVYKDIQQDSDGCVSQYTTRFYTSHLQNSSILSYNSST